MKLKTKGLPNTNQANSNQALKNALMQSLEFGEQDINNIVDRAVSPNSSNVSESQTEGSNQKKRKDDTSNTSSSYSLRAQKRKEA